MLRDRESPIDFLIKIQIPNSKFDRGLTETVRPIGHLGKFDVHDFKIITKFLANYS